MLRLLMLLLWLLSPTLPVGHLQVIHALVAAVDEVAHATTVVTERSVRPSPVVIWLRSRVALLTIVIAVLRDTSPSIA
jgi:hypothetical protein